MLRQNKQGSQNSLKVWWTIFKICLLQQDKWKTNQNMIATINHQCTIQIKFHHHSLVTENTGHC